jgi:salicylate hydroxylase
VARWHEGRSILIGDAAHPTLPYLAQGAAMALEDAVALAQGWEDFAAFTRRRQVRTARVTTQSRGMAGIYHAAGVKRMARNAIIRMTTPDLFLSRLAWLYAFDPTEG